MAEIEIEEIQVTKTEFFRLIDHFRNDGLNLELSYIRTVDLCKSKGCQPYFKNYESFKDSHYQRLRKRI